MIPHANIGLLGLLAIGGALTLHPKRQRTDVDRLKDIDVAEKRYLEKIANPTYIAAQQKRERKRARLAAAARN